MALAKGFKAFMGVGRETTLGTVVARTVFQRFNSETLKFTNRVLNSNRLAPSQQVVEQGLRFSSGSIAFDGGFEGMEYFFKDTFGQDTITTPGGATLARLHTFALTDDLPSPGATIEIFKGGPDTNSHIYADMKIRRMRISSRFDALMEVECEFIGRAETRAAMSTPTYPALLPVAPGHLAITIDSVAVSARGFEISIDETISGEDRPTVDGRDILEPERIGSRVVEGTITLDYDSVTNYNKFVNFTDSAIVATWTGGLIEGGQNYTITLTMPRVKYSGETPNAASPAVLPLSLPFRCYETTAGAANEISATIKNKVTSVI